MIIFCQADFYSLNATKLKKKKIDENLWLNKEKKELFEITCWLLWQVLSFCCEIYVVDEKYDKLFLGKCDKINDNDLAEE